jgi:hypothetical protein
MRKETDDFWYDMDCPKQTAFEAHFDPRRTFGTSAVDFNDWPTWMPALAFVIVQHLSPTWRAGLSSCCLDLAAEGLIPSRWENGLESRQLN